MPLQDPHDRCRTVSLRWYRTASCVSSIWSDPPLDSPIASRSNLLRVCNNTLHVLHIQHCKSIRHQSSLHKGHNISITLDTGLTMCASIRPVSHLPPPHTPRYIPAKQRAIYVCNSSSNLHVTQGRSAVVPDMHTAKRSVTTRRLVSTSGLVSSRTSNEQGGTPSCLLPRRLRLRLLAAQYL
jgi:hypothetical protein